jgi:hypothetical protein
VRLGALFLIGLAHPASLSPARFGGEVQAVSIFVILSLRLGPRGTSTVTTSPRL